MQPSVSQRDAEFAAGAAAPAATERPKRSDTPRGKNRYAASGKGGGGVSNPGPGIMYPPPQ